MNLADILVAAGFGAGGGGTVVALINAVFNRGGKRAEAAKAETEADALEHDTWFKEANAAYARVDKECKECKTQLRESDERHGKEIGKLRREVGELRDALIKSVDRVDELLPYVQDLPDDKMRELRAANRAVRRAVWVQQ